ncbi:hypothetical protein OFO99_37020, partial [Escherichia coli]|nr:hypothetical protein [Escherichia coli]
AGWVKQVERLWASSIKPTRTPAYLAAVTGLLGRKTAFAMLFNKTAYLTNSLWVFIGGHTTASKYPLVKLA